MNNAQEAQEIIRFLGEINSSLSSYLRKEDELREAVELAESVLEDIERELGPKEKGPNVIRAKELIASIKGFIKAREHWRQSP